MTRHFFSSTRWVSQTLNRQTDNKPQSNKHSCYKNIKTEQNKNVLLFKTKMNTAMNLNFTNRLMWVENTL